MVWTILGALGSCTTFAVAVWMIVRAVLRQVRATEDNTKALNRLSEAVDKMDGKMDDHEIRITRLETKVEARR